MISESRPSSQELKYFASLINAKGSGDRPAGLSAQDYVRKLDYHGITMLALERGSLPDDVAALLVGRKALMVANEALKRQALIEIFEAFSKANLKRSILFKGGALAYTIYDHSWLRPRSDIDCLIDSAEHADFANVLFELGYDKLFAIEGDLVSYQHTYSKPLAGKSVMNLDLHWRINNRQALAQSFNVDELLKDSSALSTVSDTIRIPNHSDSLLIAGLHRLGHHPHEERLTWLNDIHKLTQNLQAADWLEICEKAAQKELAGITLDALNHAKELFDSHIPKSALDSLEMAAETYEPSQVFLNRGLAEWRYFWADLGALPSLKSKLQLIRENVFPNQEYVKQQMGTRSIIKAYLSRAWRGLKRVWS